MSMHNLTRDGEFRYIVQWFNEWSELQRDDFVPVLVEYLMQVGSAASSNAVTTDIHMNGIVHAVANTDIHERPMSLFQCRIKLFRDWCTKWPEDFKQKLLQKIAEIDNKVGEKIINELKLNNNSNALQTNGILEGEVIDNEEVNNVSAVLQAAQSLVTETEAAINADVRLVNHLLEQITPVADNNCNNLNNSNDVEGGENTNDNNNGVCVDDAQPLSADIEVEITQANNVLVEPAEPVQFSTQEHTVSSSTTPLTNAISI